MEAKIDHPWVGERESPPIPVVAEPPMPHASLALLEIGDLLPEYLPDLIPPTPTPEMAPTDMPEEEWLRELARRIERMAPRFGAVDRNVRRELELAARMLNSYAILWEKRNMERRKGEA